MCWKSMILQFFGVYFALHSIESVDLSNEPILFPETFVPRQIALTDSRFNGIADEVTELSQAATAFSLEFKKHISMTVTENSTNVVFAPFSIWALLLPLVEGSSGGTFEQLTRVLHLPSNFTKLRGAFKIFEHVCNDKFASIGMEQAKVLFFDINRPFYSDFQDALDYTFGTEYIPINFFKPNEAVNEINNYVEGKSRAKITETIEIHDLRMTYIMPVSIASFRGQSHASYKASLIEQPFYNEFGGLVDNVVFFACEGSTVELGPKVIEIPYGNGNKFSMLIILPEKNTPIQQFISKLDASHLNNLLQFINQQKRDPDAPLLAAESMEKKRDREREQCSCD